MLIRAVPFLNDIFSVVWLPRRYQRNSEICSPGFELVKIKAERDVSCPRPLNATQRSGWPRMSPPVPDHAASPPTSSGQSKADKRAENGSSGGQRRRALGSLRQDADDGYGDASLMKK